MFENVLGHKSIIEKLETVVEQDTPSHAYVFYGKDGIGKRLVAKEFAKGLLKTNNLDASMDFKLVSKMPDKQNILVEQIRDEVIADVYTAPAASKYKVYIIDEADKMNDSSQNAFLKTLEEPPKSVIIILVTSNIDGLLGTILSRTTNIYFEPLDIVAVKKYLKERGVEVSDEYINFAGGSISTVLSITDGEVKEMFERVTSAVEAIKAQDTLEVINALKEVNLKDDLVVQYFEYLMLENNMYSGINELESLRQAISHNANEDMQKTKLAINLCRV